MGSRHPAAKDRGFITGGNQKVKKMLKRRHLSGDCGSESSGYHSSSDTQIANTEDLLTRQEAEHLLSLSKSSGSPIISCDNSGLGCPVKSYPRVVGLHSQHCQFQEIRKLSVRSRLNLLGADERKFRSFCSSFDSSKKVLFLYKLTKERNSVKICAQNYDNKEYTYTLTMYDKSDRHIHKITAKTGLDIHTVPAKVFAEVGNSVKYKIQIMK